MNSLLMQDAARHPKLFAWHGAITANRLEAWVKERNLNLPKDLIKLWEVTGGGELFETETILSPFSDAHLGDDIDSVNNFHHSQGMGVQYIVFHQGIALSAVRLTDGCYVKLDDNYQECASFMTLQDWYIAEIRSEYANRYKLDRLLLKHQFSTKQLHNPTQ